MNQHNNKHNKKKQNMHVEFKTNEQSILHKQVGVSIDCNGTVIVLFFCRHTSELLIKYYEGWRIKKGQFYGDQNVNHGKI